MRIETEFFLQNSVSFSQVMALNAPNWLRYLLLKQALSSTLYI